MAKPKQPTQPRPPSVVLSQRDLTIAEAVLDGKSIAKAAAEAGCSPATARNVVKSAGSVKMHIADNRHQLATVAQIQRADVIAGFMEAIDTARIACDPGSMIRGWTEIGKMLGLYAPEKVEVTVTAGQRAIQSKYEIMSDEELYARMEALTIEGECTTVQ